MSTIINDSQLNAYVDQISCCEELDEILSEFVSVLETLKDSAVKSGGVHDVLVQVHELVSDIYEKNHGLGTRAASEISSFLSYIEELDLEIYRG